MRPTVPILLCSVFGFAAAASAGSPRVAEMVDEGIAHYEAEDFTAAAESFADADVARPDDPWIMFDLATAYVGQGDLKKAEELFQRSALSRDQGLAVRSHYNLGTIAAGKARAVFGKRPQDASPEVRQEGLALLAQAVAHYRDCLELDKNHADARHNLELIRLWTKQMQALWQERDRQKQREEMNLLEFLAMLEARQRALRLTSKSLDAEPDSPKRRQALSTTETSQRQLAEETEPLKEKIAATLQPAQPPAGATGAASPPPAEISQAVELLDGLADEAGRAMQTAADALDDDSPADAVRPQTDAVDKLDQIYLGVVPFANLVQRAILTQQGLIDQVAPAVEAPEEHDGFDPSETAWDQGFVARWSEILPAKAKQELERLQAAPNATAPRPRDDDAAGCAGEPEAINKLQEGLKQSMRKAVELGPKVQELTAEAAEKLQQQKPDDALPKQEEALKLLKEIADPLPKQDQQNRQHQGQQQRQKDQQRDQQQSAEGQQQRQARRPQDLSKQQAEAVLRKARERQRERRELEKQLQQYLYRPGKVEKDW